MNQQSGRVAKWDNLKFLLILCVVIGHFLSSFEENNPYAQRLIFFIYIFHMPAFVFVSGLFAKKAIDGKRFDKVFSFLIMFIVTRYILVLGRVIVEQKFGFYFFTINNVAWYALAICVYYLVTMFLRQFKFGYVLCLALVVACVSGYARDIGTFLTLSRLITFYPFFVLGYYLKADDILRVTGKKQVKIISAVLLIVIAGISYKKADDLYWMMELFRGRRSYLALGDVWEFGALLRFGWYIVALLVVFALIALMPSVHTIFTRWGSRTMQVYVLHHLPQDILFNEVGGILAFELWPGIEFIVVLVIAFAVTCVLSVKPITIFLNAIIFPRKRIEQER